ncbi:MAG: hypothetical protein WAN23_12880 [Candidatus Acidiferrales bacterium]
MENAQPGDFDRSSTGPLGGSFKDAIRFWEPRRLAYNLVLIVATGAWLALAWPHFRPALTLPSLAPLAVLALLANVCYCAAYLVDLPLQRSSLSVLWRRRRWILWSLGTLFAFILANYWIADEIYPFVR